MSSDLEQLSKLVGESILYDMDFTKRLKSGETISSVTSVTSVNQNRVESSSNITISGQVLASPIVQFRIADGTAGECYKIVVEIVTSDSNTRIGEGLFLVE